MSRFVRIGPIMVFDKSRILEVARGKSLFTGRSSLRIKTYKDFDSDHGYIVKPIWFWMSIKFETVADRDAAFAKVKQFVPEKVPVTLIIEEL